MGVQESQGDFDTDQRKEIVLIWLASYPRSGNSWVRQMIAFQMEGCTTVRGAEKLIDSGKCGVKKTHRYWESMKNLTKDEKVVYVVRDPRACIASFRVFLSRQTGNARIAKIRDLDELLGSWMKPWTDWSKHINGWMEHENLLPIRYERLHNSPRTEVWRLMEFLELPSDEESIGEVIETCSFKKMKGSDSGGRMIRKGKTHVWKEELPRVMIRQIEARWGETMSMIGYRRLHE